MHLRSDWLHLYRYKKYVVPDYLFQNVLIYRDSLRMRSSAGGAVEKCVSGKRSIIGSVSTSNAGKDEQFSGGEENVKVKPLQWSLSAAAGAQFKITEKLGIYAEPGVVYYFDDGSNVNTIRKEHPFNFNIQLGVRFTLPK